jgi:hypothetical protein
MRLTVNSELQVKLRIITDRRFAGTSDRDLRNVELSTEQVERSVKLGRKDCLPLAVTDQLLDLEGKPTNFSLVIADFDRKAMPEGWTEERLDASIRAVEGAICFQSVSGMPKAMFLVEGQDGPVSRAQAVELLKATLQADLHWFDPYGLFKCFMTQATAQVLQKQLVTCRAVKVIAKQDSSTSECNELLRHVAPHKLALASSNIHNIPTIPSTYLFCNAFADDIPEQLRHLAKNEAQSSMLRLLLSCWNLLNPLGYGLSQHRIADQLNIDVMQVNRFLKQLQRLDLLHKTSKTYAQGSKAQCYRAKGILARAIRKLKDKPRKRLELPQVWQSGNTYRPMLNLLWVNQTLDLPSWLHLVQSIPGATPARLNDATRYWQCQQRKLLAGKARLQKQA